MKFMGYERPGRVGGSPQYVVLVMSVADCSEPVARQISKGFDDVHFGYSTLRVYSREHDRQHPHRGLRENPNVAGLLLVGMGCEGMPPGSSWRKRSPKAASPWILDHRSGRRRDPAGPWPRDAPFWTEMLEETSKAKRTPLDVSRLIVGVKCGGSDTTSGLAGNPAVGAFSDQLVDLGGSIIMMEPIEAIGAEEALARRAVQR